MKLADVGDRMPACEVNLIFLQKTFDLGRILVYGASSLGLISFHPHLLRTDIVHSRDTCTIFGRRVTGEHPLAELVHSIHILLHSVHNLRLELRILLLAPSGPEPAT